MNSDRTTRRVAMRGACLGWLVAAGVSTETSGQSPVGQTSSIELQLELAADQEQLGPPGWLAARDWLLAQTGESRPDDPWTSLRLRFDGVHWVALSTQPRASSSPNSAAVVAPSNTRPDAIYSSATLTYYGWQIRATCDRDGRERWQVRRTERATPTRAAGSPPLADALAALGISDDGQPIVVDTSAWIGRFIDSCEGHDTATQLLLLAGACGPTSIVLSPTRTKRGWTVIGRSHGGLLLPALLTLLAAQSGQTELPPALHWQNRHALRATTRLDDGAAEATRQLAGRMLRAPQTPTWQEALECQLFATDDRQTIAAAGLLRSGDTRAWRTVAAFHISENQNPAGYALTELAERRLAVPTQGASALTLARTPAKDEPGDPRLSTRGVNRRQNGLLGGTILALILAAALWFRSRTA